MNFNDSQAIYFGISEKKDGSMKSSPANRLLFFKNKNLNHKILVSAGLVHKNRMVIVDNTNQDKIIPDCDALITNQNKYLLTITVADCLPLYFYDTAKKVVAIAHAGWRGVMAEVAEKVINLFINNYDSKRDDIKVFIGPHIRACHFEVKEDVAGQFKKREQVIRNEKIYINLCRAVKDQLIKLGIGANQIKISQECTFCLSDKYFSFRRDKPKELETMIAYIGIK